MQPVGLKGGSEQFKGSSLAAITVKSYLKPSLPSSSIFVHSVCLDRFVISSELKLSNLLIQSLLL